LIRQFSAEKLGADAGAESSARAAHLRYFDKWLQRITDVPRAEEPKANTLIEGDLENLRLMWRHAVATLACDTLAATAVPLMRFFELRSRWIEGEQVLGEAANALAIHTSDGHAAKSARANIWRALATLDFRAGQRTRCIERAERSLRLCRELSIRKGIKGNLNNLGLAHWQLGHLAEAEGFFAQAVEEARADGDTEGEAIFLGNSALVAKAQGNYRSALLMNEAALAVHRALDNRVSILTTLNNLGNLYRALQQPRQTIVVLTEALARADQHARLSTKIFILCNLALAHADLGEYQQALAHAEASEALQCKGGEPGLEASIRQVLARALTGIGRFDEAREHLAHALRLSLAERRVSLAVGTLMHWGRLIAAQGDSVRAVGILAFAVSNSEIDGPDRDVAARELALIEQRLGPERAEQARRDAPELTLEVLAAQLLTDAIPVPQVVGK
jgi:tetratricopeptide (TPR) repeat protein